MLLNGDTTGKRVSALTLTIKSMSLSSTSELLLSLFVLHPDVKQAAPVYPTESLSDNAFKYCPSMYASKCEEEFVC